MPIIFDIDENFLWFIRQCTLSLKLPKIFTKSPLGQTIGGEEGGIESYCDTDKCVVQ